MDAFPKEGGKWVKTEAVEIDTTYIEENIVDLLTPNASSLAGPLIFLGINILDSQQVNTINLTNLPKSFIKVIIDA